MSWFHAPAVQTGWLLRTVIVVLSAVMHTLAHSEPRRTLADGAHGKIEFHSYTPASQAPLLARSYLQQQPVVIGGELALPERSPLARGGRMPAVILMHGSSGISEEREHAWAKRLNAIGVATFIVDSFTGGGIRPPMSQLSRYGQKPKTIAGQTEGRGLTGSVLSISEHSAGIFWLQPAEPAAAAEAQLVAVEVAPDGRSGAPDAVAAVGPPEGVAARPFGAVEVLASPSAEPDAAVVAAAQPGVVAQPVEFAAEASARPAELALEARLRILAVAVAAVERLAVAPFPERPALLRGPEPNRQLSAAPPEVPAPFPALSEHPLFPGDSGPPEVSSLAGLAGQVSRWDSAPLEQVPSRPGAPEAPLCCPGLAEYWLSVTLGLEAAHWGLRWRATAHLVLLSDQAVCRERPAWLRD